MFGAKGALNKRKQPEVKKKWQEELEEEQIKAAKAKEQQQQQQLLQQQQQQQQQQLQQQQQQQEQQQQQQAAQLQSARVKAREQLDEDEELLKSIAKQDLKNARDSSEEKEIRGRREGSAGDGDGGEGARGDASNADKQQTLQAQKKKKKYEWMDSEDEDAGDSSSSEEEEVPSDEGASERGEGDDSDGQKDNEVEQTDKDARTIFVTNLHYELSDKAIFDFFSKFGKIINCDVPRNDTSSGNKGRAFVEYSAVKYAQRAVAECAQAELRGRKVDVKLGLTTVTMENATKKYELKPEKYSKKYGFKDYDRRAYGQGNRRGGGHSPQRRSRSRSIDKKRRR